MVVKELKVDFSARRKTNYIVQGGAGMAIITMFQFLIGRLVTHKLMELHRNYVRKFQFLIGRLVTKYMKVLLNIINSFNSL